MAKACDYLCRQCCFIDGLALADVLSGNDLAEVMTNYNTVQHLPSVVLHVDFNAVQ